MTAFRLRCSSKPALPLKAGQRASYAALSRRLTRLSQMPESFLSRELQNYQAVIAENFSEMRA